MQPLAAVFVPVIPLININRLINKFFFPSMYLLQSGFD
jgi:hypothetical protein